MQCDHRIEPVGQGVVIATADSHTVLYQTWLSDMFNPPGGDSLADTTHVHGVTAASQSARQTVC